jgi:hypothetical protein
MAQDDPVFKPVGRAAQPAKENDAAADVAREFRVRPLLDPARSRPRLGGDADLSRIVAGALRWSRRAMPSPGTGLARPTRMLCSGASPFLQVEAWAA